MDSYNSMKPSGALYISANCPSRSSAMPRSSTLNCSLKLLAARSKIFEQQVRSVPCQSKTENGRDQNESLEMETSQVGWRSLRCQVENGINKKVNRLRYEPFRNASNCKKSVQRKSPLPIWLHDLTRPRPR